MLRSADGYPIGIGPIVSEYRPLIAGWSAELHQSGQDETRFLTDKFGAPEAPADKPGDYSSDERCLPTGLHITVHKMARSPGGRNPPPPRTGATTLFRLTVPTGHRPTVLSQDQTVCLLRMRYRRASADRPSIRTSRKCHQSLRCRQCRPPWWWRRGLSVEQLGWWYGAGAGADGRREGFDRFAEQHQSCCAAGWCCWRFDVTGVAGVAVRAGCDGRGECCGRDAADERPTSAGSQWAAGGADKPSRGCAGAGGTRGRIDVGGRRQRGRERHPSGQWRRGGGRDASHVVVRVGAASAWNAAGRCWWWKFGVDRRRTCDAVGDWRCWDSSVDWVHARARPGSPPGISRDVSMT